MTDFSDMCDILGELYSNYKEDKNFKDFIEFNDLGLPLAYLTSENLCEPSDDGVRYITETWELFLAGLKMPDNGFETLEQLLEIAEARSREEE
jgi:hypothetical protein